MNTTGEVMPKRPRAHQLETESIKKFRSYVPSNWVVRDISDDYGIDLEVELFDADEKATGLKFYVQMKSTDNVDPKKNKKESFKIDTLDYLEKQEYPVLLAKYLSKDDKILFKWVYGKHKIPRKEGSKTYTVYFPEENVLNESSILEIASDVKKYLNFKKKIISIPVCLRLINNEKRISSANFIYENEIRDTEGTQLIRFVENEEIGTLSLNNNVVFLELGAEHASFTFELSKLDTEKELLEKVYLSVGLLLGMYELDNLSAKFLICSYKNESFFQDSKFIFILLNVFFNSNRYSDLLAIYKWLIYETKHYGEVSVYLTFLYKKYNKKVENQVDIFEKLFLENIDFCKSDHKHGLGAAYYSIGNFYSSIGKSYLSVKYYNLARKTSPDYIKRAYFWRELGAEFYNRGHVKIAKNFYKKSIELGDKGDTHAKLADCLLFEGNYSLALKEYDKYIEVVADKQKEDGSFPDPMFVVKRACIEFFLQSYKIEDSERDITLSEKLTYKHKEPTVENLIKAIEVDLLNCGALFNLGVSAAKIQKYELAMFSFALSAAFRNQDVEAWRDGFFCSMKVECQTFGALIFAAGYRYAGNIFINTLFEYADSHMSKDDSEGFKKQMLMLRNSCDSKEKFEFRLLGKDEVSIIEID